MKTLLACITLGFLFCRAQSAQIAVPRSTDCHVCQYVMKFIRYQSWEQSLPLKAVQQKLNELYKIAPSTLKAKKYLKQIDVFVSLLNEGKDPQKICQMIRKCSSVEPQRPEITACAFCTDIVDLIKLEISISNATIEVIIDAVRALCKFLGIEPVYKECNLILGEINEIIQWLENMITPTDICKRLGFCPNTTYSTRLNENKEHTCRAVVHNLRIQNRKGWSEEKMKEKIPTICKKLGLNRYHCYRILTDLNAVLTLIRRGQETDEVCGNRITSNRLVSIRNDPSNYCDFCMMIMETIGSEIGDLQTGLKSAQKKLDEICSELDDLSEECKYAVDFVMEDLERNVKYMDGILDPVTTCEELELCSKSLDQ